MNGKANKTEMQVVRFDLKYCERCGRTWLRAFGDEQVYCDACVPEVEDLPAPNARKEMKSVSGLSPESESCELLGVAETVMAEGGIA